MKNRIIAVAALLLSVFCYAQITVDNTTYTVDQLVRNVLVNSGCANVANVQFSTGTGPGQNGIAYFEHNFSGFPIRNGVILSTGNAMNAPGPNTSITLGDTIGTPGDADLDAAMVGSTPAVVSQDVSWISFDFTPQAGFVSFEFLFASEEYNGSFECTYSDAFAFLLTDTVTNTTTNLALVPGTTDQIRVTSVRNPPPSASCGPVNASFYDDYNLGGLTGVPYSGGRPAANSPTSFNGNTNVLRAQSNVISNRTYTIKLVIGDSSDTDYDSAVFIAGGSFDIGADLGVDRTVLGGNPLCAGDVYTLDASSAGAAISYQWRLNNAIIPGATNATYDATVTGNYSVDIEYTPTCSALASVFLEFVDPPSSPASDMAQCSTTTTANFDFTATAAEILGSLNPALYTVAFYETQTDAENGTNAITNTTAYTNTSNPQTIYGALIDNTFGCASVEPFDLILTDITAGTPSNLFECDVTGSGQFDFDLSIQDADVAGTNPAGTVTVTYHETQADADAGSNPVGPMYTSMVLVQTIYARVALNSDVTCYDTVSFDLTINQAPVVGTITSFSECSTTAIGVAAFDLSSKDVEIINGQTGVTVTYHESQSDADLGVNPLPTSGYVNTSNPQTIYVRLEGPAVGCVNTGTFDLIVNQQPVAQPVQNLISCDDLSNDGVVNFDLSVLDDVVRGTQNPSNFVVTYHETAADAASGANPVALNYSNTTNPQTLFVRLENDVNSDCYDDSIQFDLIINPAPVAAQAPDDLIACDDNNPGDEVETFDLTAVEPQIIGTQNFADIVISYHTNMADAVSGINPIVASAAYDNLTNPQTIYVRLENTVTGCVNGEITFDLVVNELPAVVTPALYDLCDDSTADGFTTFDLSSRMDEITGNNSGYTVFYYETLIDAQLRANELAANYTNISNPQTLFVVVEDNTTGCVNTTTLDLEVADAPATSIAPNVELCDDNNPGDLAEDFDLTQNEAIILNGQTGITITYHTSFNDADMGVNAIANPTSYQNTLPQQRIFVRLENSTGCYKLTSFNILVNEVPVPQMFDEYLICVDAQGNLVNTPNSPPFIQSGLASAGLTYQWDVDGMIIPGETTANITATTPGVYTITVTNSTTGCMNSQSTLVRTLDPPTSFGADVISDYFDETHRIIAFANGDASQYIFSLDDGPWQYTGTFNAVSPGPHQVFIQDIDGCNTVQVDVDVIGYPRFFTPNGDGFNDTWNIIGINNEPSTKIYIFDRYGKLLKQIDPSGLGWDGIFNGQPLPSSDYWFRVDYVEDGRNKTFGGHFTLKR